MTATLEPKNESPSSGDDNDSSSTSGGSENEAPEKMMVAKKRKRTNKEASNVDAAEMKRKRSMSMEMTFELLKPGMVVVGRVFRLEEAKQFAMIKYIPGVTLQLALTEVSDKRESMPFSNLKEGQFVKCVVLKALKVDRSDAGPEQVFQVSMRESLLEQADEKKSKLSKAVLSQELKLANEYPQEGSLVDGFVEQINKAGAFVRITRGIRAIVPLRHLADIFVKDVEKEFPVGRLVAGRVLKVDSNKNSVVLSLRSSLVLGKKLSTVQLNDINVGDKFEGIVKQIKPYGVFVALGKANGINGLCHWSEMSDEPNQESINAYNMGDLVRVMVLSVDKDARRIALSMKPSHFENDQEEEDSEEEEEEGELVEIEQAENDDDDDEASESSDDDDDESSDDEVVKKLLKERALEPMEEDSDGDDDEEEDEEDGDEEEEEEKEQQQPSKTLSLQDALKQAKGSKGWSLQELEDKDDGDDSEDDDDEEGAKDKKESKESMSKKKLSKLKQRQKRLEEAEIIAKEQALLEDDQAPQSVDDFERLILASPNSSLLWIQYMKFQVKQTEIDQARAIAERALGTINMREEEEKQNVWFAWLWVEYKFGSPASFESVKEKILQRMNRKHAFYKIAEMYQEGGEMDKAHEALKKAIKASKSRSCGAWLRLVGLFFDMKQPDDARKTFNDGLKALEDRKVVKFTLGFIRLEFTKGDAEYARTVYEKALVAHPKRTDMWHQIIDAETKFGGENNQDKVRELYERVASMKLSVKKMKTFFKKWMAFETDHGTEDTREMVKERARQFVSSVAGK